MNVLIINGSPSGEESITLCTMRYIKKLFPDHRYKVLHVGRQIRKMEQEPELWQKPLSAMVNNEKIRKKMNGKMTEGMLIVCFQYLRNKCGL